MSLNNVDKGSSDRSQPSPNSPDVNPNPLAHGTVSINPRAAGTQASAKVITQDSKIIAFDGNNNIGLFGFDDSGNMAIKVAKPGFDANTASASNLIFNSSQDAFKIAAILTGSLALSFNSFTSGSAGTFSANSTNTLTLAHNLGITPVIVSNVFVPSASIYLTISDGSLIDPSTVTNPLIGGNANGIVSYGTYTWRIWADTTNVYIRGVVSGGGGTNTGGYTVGANNMGTWSFKVYCLQETAN